MSSTAKTAREKREEYARKIAAQRKAGVLNQSRTTKPRVPLSTINSNRRMLNSSTTTKSKPTPNSSRVVSTRTASASRTATTSRISSTSRVQTSRTISTRPTNSLKRKQPLERNPLPAAKRPRTAISARTVTKQTSRRLAEEVEEAKNQENMLLKKQVLKLEKNSEELRFALQKATDDMEETSENIQMKTEELTKQQHKQIHLQGERDRLKIESQEKQETTNLLQLTLKDIKDRFSFQLEAEEAKFEALSYSHKALKEQHSLTSSRLSNAKQTLSSQEAQISTNEREYKDISNQLQQSTSNNTKYATKIEKLNKKIESYKSQIQQLEETSRNDEKIRRKLHDCILDLKGTVRVFIRTHDNKEGEQSIFDYPDPWRAQTLQMNPNSIMEKLLVFEFDKVFNSSKTNENLFNELDSLIFSAVDGNFVNIFTHNEDCLHENPLHSSAQYSQLIHHSLNLIFDKVKRMKKIGWNFSVVINCVYIKNESFADVLSNQSTSSNISRKPIRDVNYVKIENTSQFNHLFDEIPEEINDNDNSNTTIILQAHIDAENHSTGETCSGLMNIVSLPSPSSENDNKSLSTLNSVICSLANQDSNVPFRQSKLTSLLKETLVNDSKTLFIINIDDSPARANEHLNMLRFAKEINSCNIGTHSNSKPKRK